MDSIALILSVIGCLNWGLIGIFQFDQHNGDILLFVQPADLHHCRSGGYLVRHIPVSPRCTCGR